MIPISLHSPVVGYVAYLVHCCCLCRQDVVDQSSGSYPCCSGTTVSVVCVVSVVSQTY